MKLFKISLSIICVLFFCHHAEAVTLRYALVVGNNSGVDADGTEPFVPLKHAESEAQKLKKHLIGLSNFDSSNTRTVLLLGATKAKVQAAIEAIVRQRKKDEQLLKKVDTIFLFYFTGHGLEGRLLLKDGPLYSNEISALYNRVNADFAVGVFDACHSGSLSPKGIAPTPGLNLFRELPQEVLSAKGSIWYVSSGTNQASYEDKDLGGVFTHFFIKALANAQREGPGITLDSIWSYASKHTVSYTAKQNIQQNPQQFISSLKSSAPIYFSFPLERSVTLVFADSLEGHFALTYADGQLTEMIDKRVGKPKKVAIYPGQARLTYIKNGKIFPVEEFRLKNGETLVLKGNLDQKTRTSVGKKSQSLWTKGLSSNKSITAYKVNTGISVLGGVSYKFSYAAKEVLSPRNTFAFNIRLDHSKILGYLSIGYGFDRRDFQAWGYKNDAVTGQLRLGTGFDLGMTRLSLAGVLGFSHMWQKYNNGKKRTGQEYNPALYWGVLFPRTGLFSFEAFLSAGAIYAPGLGMDTHSIWSFTASAGLILYFRCI